MSVNQKNLSAEINSLIQALENINTGPGSSGTIPIKYKFDRNRITEITTTKTESINNYIENIREIHQIINQINISRDVEHVFGIFSSNKVNLGPSDNFKLNQIYETLVRKIKIKPRIKKTRNLLGIETEREFIDEITIGGQQPYTITKRYLCLDYPRLDSPHAKIYLRYLLGTILCFNIAFSFIGELISYYTATPGNISFTNITIGSNFNEANIVKSLKKIFDEEVFNSVLENNKDGDDFDIKILNSDVLVIQDTINGLLTVKELIFLFNNIEKKYEISSKPRDTNPGNYLDLKMNFTYDSNVKKNSDGTIFVYEKCIEPYGEGDKDQKQYDERGKEPNFLKIKINLEDIALNFEIEVRYYYCKYFGGVNINFRYQFIIRINENTYYVNPYDEYSGEAYKIDNLLKYTDTN